MPLRLDCDIDHGGNQGRRNAVTRHLRNKQADSSVFTFQEVIKVARYGGQGFVSCGNGEMFCGRGGSRKDGELNSTCDFKLLLNGAQLLFAVEGPPSRYIAQAAHQNSETVELICCRVSQKLHDVRPQDETDEHDHPGTKDNCICRDGGLAKSESHQ